MQSVVTDGYQNITTVYIGSYYEQITTSGVVTTTDWKKYYYAGSIRLAMRENSDEPLYLIGDHLGSTSLVVDSLGQEVARQSYLPFGEEWGSSATDLPTSFTYTGQREAAEIGLHYYIARWYDAGIGHFLQADTIVPGVGNPMAWNRYGYVLYNPLKYIDPSGHWYIEGWKEEYLQKQEGNTSAVVAAAGALSILYNKKITQQDVQPLFFQTYPKFFGGIGVPPKQQALFLNSDPEIEARMSQGTRDDILHNLQAGNPTLVTIALPIHKGAGHVLLVIGYEPETDEFIFFNPARGREQSEFKISEYYHKQYGNDKMDFNDLWAEKNIFVTNNAMVTLQRIELNPIPIKKFNLGVAKHIFYDIDRFR
jgi:RHS repeat-associated protein